MRNALNSAVFFGAASCAVLFAGGPARADDAGDKALAAVDEAMNRAKTQYFEYDVTNQEPGKPEAKLGMTVRLKGEKRLTEFTAPADMKGTKVLILGPAQTYVYLPAFGKVRRVASSVSDQGFMGMTYTQDDFQTKYGDVYTATSAGGVLVLTPKPGQQPPYAKIEITLDPAKGLPSQLKYYNAANVNVKTELRTNYTCEGNVCTATEQKMIDNTKSGAWTKMVRKTWKLNEAMPDDMFSKRALEK
jgi:outer membrane lipoprotein-sorting protein